MLLTNIRRGRTAEGVGAGAAERSTGPSPYREWVADIARRQVRCEDALGPDPSVRRHTPRRDLCTLQPGHRRHLGHNLSQDTTLSSRSQELRNLLLAPKATRRSLELGKWLQATGRDRARLGRRAWRCLPCWCSVWHYHGCRRGAFRKRPPPGPSVCGALERGSWPVRSCARPHCAAQWGGQRGCRKLKKTAAEVGLGGAGPGIRESAPRPCQRRRQRICRNLW